MERSDKQVQASDHLPLLASDLIPTPDQCYIRKGKVENKTAWLILDGDGKTIGVAVSEAAAILSARDHGLEPFLLS